MVPTTGALLFTLANLCVKLSLAKDRAWLMYVAYGGSVLAYWMFRRVCETKGLAMTEGIFGSLITVTTVLVGLFFLRETLLPRQYVALGLIVCGLILIQ